MIKHVCCFFEVPYYRLDREFDFNDILSWTEKSITLEFDFILKKNDEFNIPCRINQKPNLSSFKVYDKITFPQNINKKFMQNYFSTGYFKFYNDNIIHYIFIQLPRKLVEYEFQIDDSVEENLNKF